MKIEPILKKCIHCSPASAIFASIVTILVSFEAILKMFPVRINFKSQFQRNDLPQLTSFKILTNFVTILASIEQVNTPLVPM